MLSPGIPIHEEGAIDRVVISGTNVVGIGVPAPEEAQSVHSPNNVINLQQKCAAR